MYAHVFVCVAAMACLIYQTSKIQNRLCVLEVPPACRFQKVFYTPACAAKTGAPPHAQSWTAR